MKAALLVLATAASDATCTPVRHDMVLSTGGVYGDTCFTAVIVELSTTSTSTIRVHDTSRIAVIALPLHDTSIEPFGA